jgi:hypothetical protein
VKPEDLEEANIATDSGNPISNITVFSCEDNGSCEVLIHHPKVSPLSLSKSIQRF